MCICLTQIYSIFFRIEKNYIHDQSLIHENIAFSYVLEHVPLSNRVFMESAIDVFNNNLMKECGGNCTLVSDNSVSVHFTVNSDDLSLDWSTDEGYSLDLSSKGNFFSFRFFLIYLYY